VVARALPIAAVAAGVPLLRRTALQAMGYGQIVEWKTLFAWHQWRSRR